MIIGAAFDRLGVPQINQNISGTCCGRQVPESAQVIGSEPLQEFRLASDFTINAASVSGGLNNNYVWFQTLLNSVF